MILLWNPSLIWNRNDNCSYLLQYFNTLTVMMTRRWHFPDSAHHQGPDRALTETAFRCLRGRWGCLWRKERATHEIYSIITVMYRVFFARKLDDLDQLEGPCTTNHVVQQPVLELLRLNEAKEPYLRSTMSFIVESYFITGISLISL
jgi:hypothetical protein